MFCFSLGTYQNNASSEACESCPSGYECTANSTTICLAGFFSKSGQMTCDECPQGTKVVLTLSKLINLHSSTDLTCVWVSRLTLTLPIVVVAIELVLSVKKAIVHLTSHFFTCSLAHNLHRNNYELLKSLRN